MRVLTSTRGWLSIVLGVLFFAAPLLLSAESYDYQDYRDAGYFDDGFYADDWFYDWYDTGYYHGDGDADFSHYYESTDDKGHGLFEFSERRPLAGM
jgi:hypothetical protein